MENNAAEILLADRLTDRRQEAQDRNSALDIRQYRGVYRTRLILRILSFATCIAMLVVLIDAIRSYMRTKHVTNPFRDGSGSFPVWPEGLKLYPTYMFVGAALVAGVFSLLLIIASFHKSVRRMTKTGDVTTLIVSFICLVAWVVVTAYYGSWDTKTTNWDLLSWTCKHQDPAYDYDKMDFSEMCTELRFAFWAGVGLAGMEAFNLTVFVVWWFGTRRSSGYKTIEEGKESKNKSWIPDMSGFFS